MEEENLVFYFIFLVLCLIATVGGYFVYSGLLYAVNVETKQKVLKNFRVAYKFARGPYKECGHLFTEAHSVAPNLKTFAIYYDNPQQVAPHSLRYCVGSVLSDDPQAPKNEELMKDFEKYGFKEVTFPEMEYAVCTTFPFNGTLSLFLATIKVYPKLTEYITERDLTAHPVIEIYEPNQIKYFVPLSRQEEFYVPEALEVEEEILNSESDIPSEKEAEGVDQVLPRAPSSKEEVENGSENSESSYEKVSEAFDEE